MSDVKDELVAVAQRLIQTNGFNGFSFRDIASIVGIKSASIHYHFPTKADLGAAAAAAYTQDFMEQLSKAADSESSVENLLSVYISLFRQTLLSDGKMCLCGMLGAEMASLPKEVQDEVSEFFKVNLQWLAATLGKRSSGKGHAKAKLENEAASLLAQLEGAMTLAKGLDDMEIFERVTRQIPVQFA